ncbi:MAG: AAA family ATPase, partial [Rhodocyclaceae bacterium]|nr:AAA family ATPase [Rhodocyclaceae bacterium]
MEMRKSLVGHAFRVVSEYSAVAVFRFLALLTLVPYALVGSWFATILGLFGVVVFIKMLGMVLAMFFGSAHSDSSKSFYWRFNDSLEFALMWPLIDLLVAAILYNRFGVLQSTAPVLAALAWVLPGEVPTTAPIEALDGLRGWTPLAAEGILSWTVVVVPAVTVVNVVVMLAVAKWVAPSEAYFKKLLLFQNVEPEPADEAEVVADEEPARAMATAQPAARAESGSAQADGDIVYRARWPSVSFKDVVGMEDFKRRLLEAARLFEHTDGNGILLMGEPGNGKTFMAEALAGSLKTKFIRVETTELTSKWVGETTERVAQIFKDARKQAPVVLFIDEIDSFLTDRSAMVSDGSSAARDQLSTANAFLTEIAALNRGYTQHRVLVVAASNFGDNIDAAAAREGRFDVKIVVPPPDFQARLHLLKSSLPPEMVQQFDEESVRLSVKRWEDWSSARIRKISDRLLEHLRQHPHDRVDSALLRRIVDEMLQGQGMLLPEDTPLLSELHYAPQTTKHLRDLARMWSEPDIVERLGGVVPRGAVFYGPPGTGKTTAIKALAKETGLRLLVFSGADLKRPERIDEVIKKASNIRPCIVFIDEAETILGDRRNNPFNAELTNKLLTVIDGPRKLHDVFFVAATNHPDMLDDAVLREGRLSEHIDFSPHEDS